MVSETVVETVPESSHPPKTEVDLENRTTESIALPDSGSEKNDSEKKCDDDNRAIEECSATNVSHLSFDEILY